MSREFYPKILGMFENLLVGMRDIFAVEVLYLLFSSSQRITLYPDRQ